VEEEAAEIPPARRRWRPRLPHVETEAKAPPAGISGGGGNGDLDLLGNGQRLEQSREVKAARKTKNKK
jgi:hypothetical protein